jgi:NAD(P)-dependent dehydrogenase (short-subunit alcohol dehydrogenase family)
VLVIGGAEPLGQVVADRLAGAGHHLALLDVAASPAVSRHSAGSAVALRPIELSGDRADVEDVARVVEGADLALAGLDSVVILPGAGCGAVGMDADGTAWADLWSGHLAGDVLAASCAAHAAARLFVAHRRAGRIVLVTGRREPDGTGSAMAAAVSRAAVGALGAELAAALAPHGIAVSVVTAGAAGADFAIGQVADLVAALLSTPVLTGVTARVG